MRARKIIFDYDCTRCTHFKHTLLNNKQQRFFGKFYLSPFLTKITRPSSTLPTTTKFIYRLCRQDGEVNSWPTLTLALLTYLCCIQRWPSAIIALFGCGCIVREMPLNQTTTTTTISVGSIRRKHTQSLKRQNVFKVTHVLVWQQNLHGIKLDTTTTVCVRLSKHHLWVNQPSELNDAKRLQSIGRRWTGGDGWIVG